MVDIFTTFTINLTQALLKQTVAVAVTQLSYTVPKHFPSIAQ